MSEIRPDSTQPVDQTVPAAQTQFEPAPKKTSNGVKAAVAGVAALAVAAGGVAALDPFDWRTDAAAGPASVLPADVIAYGAVDVDPKLSQQVEMVRFAMKFPSLKQKVSLSEGGDLKAELWKAIAKDDKCASTVNYDSEVKPWLGDQAALALRKDSKDPVAVIEAKDEAKAKAVFDKLNACSKSTSKPAFAYTGGYLVVAQSQAEADAVVSEGKANPLGKRAEFVEDFDKVGTTGVLNFWATKEALDKAAESQAAQSGDPTGSGLNPNWLEQVTMRSAAGTVRFSGGNPEMHYVMKSTEPLKASEKKTAVGNLPAESTVALGLANGATVVEQAWPQIKKAIEEQGNTIADIEQQTKLKLPGDLYTLVGSDFRLSVGEVNTSMQNPTDFPVAISSSTDKAKLTELVTRLGLDAQGAKVTGTDTDPVVALNDTWATNVAQPSGKLADQDLYKNAVVDADKAESAVYVNLESLLAPFKASMPAEAQQNVEPLQAVGITSAVESGDYTAGTMRVVAK